MSHSLCALLRARGIPYQTGVPMAAWTTLRVGGPADCLVAAGSAEDVAGALRAATEAGEPVLVVGNGSNLLVRDGGIRGLVLVIGEGMAKVTVDGDLIHAEAGASLGAVARAAQVAGLTGLEAISGIPGTIGGAACMNAGAYGTEVGAYAVHVEAVDRAGNAVTLDREALAFGYRTSAIQAQSLAAVHVTLRLSPGEPEAITKAMRDYAARRREKQPLTLPSAGSFFKRPAGHFAGALIEAAGLKGISVGGAQVSGLHAGFLVNTGGATASDFLNLVALVQARVLETSGVTLEPEVRIVGCDLS